MSTKLSTANPYLRDPVLREGMVFRSVASSSAIEGIHAPFRRMARTAGTSESASAGRNKPARKTRVTTARP